MPPTSTPAGIVPPVGGVPAGWVHRADGSFADPTAGSGVTAVTGTPPIASSGGATPDISISDFDGTNRGAVPAGPNDATKYLDGTGNFTVPSGSGAVTAVTGSAPIASSGGTNPDISIADFVASGTSHARGAVPDPGASSGTTKFLREDASWAVPPNSGGTVTSIATSAPITGGTITSTGTIGVSDFIASGVSHARGTVPDPGASSGTTKFLREDASWAVPPGTGVTSVSGTAPIVSSGGTTPAISITDFVASGASHAAGAVPDPGASAGTTKFLREDATWQVPSGSSSTADALWQKNFWTDNSLLPTTNFKDSVSSWPTFSHSQVTAHMTWSTDLATAKVAAVSAVNGNSAQADWDIGSSKTVGLFVLGGIGYGSVATAGQIGIALGATSLTPNSSYAFYFKGDQGKFILYKVSAGGVFTQLASYSANWIPPNLAGEFPISAALYFNGSSNSIQCFIRFNGAQWWRIISVTDNTFTSFRYAVLDVAALGNTTSDFMLLAPVEIWYTA